MAGFYIVKFLSTPLLSVKKRKKEIRRLFSNFPETKGLKIAGKSINGLVGQVSGVD